MGQAANQLIHFIEKSPSCYHAINNMEEELKKEGFFALREGAGWKLEAGKNYYVTRNQSSLIAFKIPSKPFVNYQIVASHSDAPTFKIKENPEIEVEKHYIKLNVEPYGGMLCASWFDRPLSVAGKVVIKEENRLISKLVQIDRDLLMIPNLAIHMNREANKGYAYNLQKDMLPIWGDEMAKGTFLNTIAESILVEAKDIVASELFLYNRMKGSIWGANKEYISAPKLDDLECAYTSLQGFLKAENKESVAVLCVLDNEEVGSGTKQGADSTFLYDVLQRINYGMGKSQEEYYTTIASSFMISADNAHAVHPNHTEKADIVNRPYMNKGIVIKQNANQKYTTDSISAAIFQTICKKVNVPYQIFTNRSDMAGGSTLGNISNSKVSLNTIDIGLAQLAMHSAYETAGVEDISYLSKAIKAFYQCCIKEINVGEYEVTF